MEVSDHVQLVLESFSRDFSFILSHTYLRLYNAEK